MKPKMLIIPALFSGLAFSCFNEKIERCPLAEVDKEMITYVLGQTVNFIDSEGQLFVMTVTEQHTEWEAEYKGMVTKQMISVRLQSELCNLEIGIYLRSNCYYYDRYGKGLVIFIPPFSFGVRYDIEGQYTEEI